MVEKFAYLFANLLAAIVAFSLLRLEIGIVAGLLLALAITAIAILIHELGHAWAAHRLGYKIQAICVLWVCFDLDEKHLSFSRALVGTDIGGFLFYEYGPDGPCLKHEMWIGIAGPAANFLLALLAWGVAMMLVPEPAACFALDGTVAADYARFMSEADGAYLLRKAYTDSACMQWAEIMHRVPSLLAFYSAGLGISNLLPYEGSDGDTVIAYMSGRA